MIDPLQTEPEATLWDMVNDEFNLNESPPCERPEATQINGLWGPVSELIWNYFEYLRTGPASGNHRK